MLAHLAGTTKVTITITITITILIRAAILRRFLSARHKSDSSEQMIGRQIQRCEMTKVAVVGCGVVGASWALVFARAGFDVCVYDMSKKAQESAIEFVRSALGEPLPSSPADEASNAIMGRLSTAESLEQALKEAVYIQESVSERLEIKKDLYKRLDVLADRGTIIGSSTSGLPASVFTEGLAAAHRCLVVHPINPPHLIPLVEIIPSPQTDAKTVRFAIDLMAQVGQSPIELNKEINGFVVNRLQSAVLAEAFRLVKDGICSSTDVDKAVSDGLGLRWFFMGPFETIDLNAQNGIAEYCRNLGPMYYDLAKEQADPREWDSDLVQKIERERRALTPFDALASRRSWRDQSLAAFVAMKSKVIGDR